MHEMMRAPLVNLPYGGASSAANYGINNGAAEVLGSSSHHDHDQLRRGPWTLEEDTLLSHYIARHGEGRWNMLAKCAGLKRTGKSCRLRWLNYLKPDIKRGNLTPKEQLLILELHSKWGNRWSRIAQHLPGRTDNEIKNYWRTRVQRQARQLNIESNSKRFVDAVRCYWMPRLLQKVEQQQTSSTSDHHDQPPPPTLPDDQSLHHHDHHHQLAAPAAADDDGSFPLAYSASSSDHDHHQPQLIVHPYSEEPYFPSSASTTNGFAALSTDSTTAAVAFRHEQSLGEKVLEPGCVGFPMENCNWNVIGDGGDYQYEEMDAFDSLVAASGSQSAGELCQVGSGDGDWVGCGYDVADPLWSWDDTWQYRGIGEMGI